MTNVAVGELAPSGARRRSGLWPGLAVISLAQLMVTLDLTIVAVALPSAQESIGLTDVTRQWAVTAYALTFGGLLLLGGRVGDVLGRKRSLITGVTGFALASVLGGAAANTEMLLVARGLQGAFAALIAPSTLALISATFEDPRERARAFGAFTAVSMSGGATGLILGGAFTSYASWRWCLYVNVGIGAVVIVGGLTSLPNPPAARGVRLDVPGAVLGTAGMLTLVYGLGEAGAYGWDSASIIVMLVVAVALLASFVVLQAKVANPLLPLRVLTNRNSGGAFLAMAAAAFCMLGMFLGVTYYMQSVLGYEPMQAGLAFLAYIVTAAVYSMKVASKLLLRIRPVYMIAPGLVLAAAALFLLTRLTPQSSYFPDVFPALVLFGLGVGNLAVPIMSTAMSSTQPRDSGIVSAVVNTSLQVGGSIGAALTNTLSTTAAAGYLAAHPLGALAEEAAAVHGLAVASRWAAVVALAGAVLTAVLVTANRPRAGWRHARHRRRTSSPGPPRRRHARHRRHSSPRLLASRTPPQADVPPRSRPRAE